MAEHPPARPPDVLRALVVDDEPTARRVLVGLLESRPDVRVVATCANGTEAVAVLAAEPVDVVFLDIRMPGLDGFDVLDSLGSESEPPLIVFVTAHDEHAVRAFEVGAVDYLLKPFDDDRFAATLDRVQARLRTNPRAVLRRQLQSLLASLDDPEGEAGSVGALSAPEGRTAAASGRRLAVRLGQRVEFVEVADIDWVQAENYYVRLHTAEREYLLRDTLTRLEGRLGQDAFLRVHRSALVRVDRVRSLRSQDGGPTEVVLADGTAVRVSRSRKAEVLRRLGLPVREL